MKILFVCLGNICRSPLAEAIFNEKIKQKGLHNKFQSDSCGTANYEVGNWSDPRTIRSANKNNVPINHIARQLTRADLQKFDLILAMDKNNLRDILSLTSLSFGEGERVRLMRSYDPQGEGDVPDPYYGKEKDFDEVFEILNRSIEKLIDELEK